MTAPTLRTLAGAALLTLAGLLAVGSVSAHPGGGGPGQWYCVQVMNNGRWMHAQAARTQQDANRMMRQLQRDGCKCQVVPQRGQMPQAVPQTPVQTGQPALNAQQATTLFAMMKGNRQIAFKFPADGCYARAELMCAMMQQAGVQPQKVWSFANGQPLTVQTANDPRGQVSWGYHVAPVVPVQLAPRQPAQMMVIDPSLFEQPVPVGCWVKKQTPNADPACRPSVRYTTMGQAPLAPCQDPRTSQQRLPGTGYWPGQDPQVGKLPHAVQTMANYLPLQGKLPPANLGM